MEVIILYLLIGATIWIYQELTMEESEEEDRLNNAPNAQFMYLVSFTAFCLIWFPWFIMADTKWGQKLFK